MLNVFPDILVYSLFAPFILRLALGFVFIRFGALALSGDRHRLVSLFSNLKVPQAALITSLLGLLEIVAGASLILGFYTQIGALITFIISLLLLASKLSGKPFGREGALFDFLLLSVALSLFFSGAGFLAFDLPL